MCIRDRYSTGYDFKVAKIITNELLKIYLTNRLQELERIVPVSYTHLKNMRSAVGVHVSKHLTPTFGLGFEAMGYFNTTKSKTAFDESNVRCV